MKNNERKNEPLSVVDLDERLTEHFSLGEMLRSCTADYFGIESSLRAKDKFEKTGLHAHKADTVNAPVIEEFPLCLECEFIEYNDYGVLGKVVNTTADESVMNGDNVDMTKVSAIAFDPYTHGYYKVEERVGNAFKDGLELK